MTSPIQLSSKQQYPSRTSHQKVGLSSKLVVVPDLSWTSVPQLFNLARERKV